jgi:hypothetical protein
MTRTATERTLPVRLALRSPKERPLNWTNRIRQIHRWLSIAFTLAVIVNVVALSQAKPAFWIGLLALVPLILLLLSGLYLFALPYAARWRGGRRANV